MPRSQSVGKPSALSYCYIAPQLEVQVPGSTVLSMAGDQRGVCVAAARTQPLGGQHLSLPAFEKGLEHPEMDGVFALREMGRVWTTKADGYTLLFAELEASPVEVDLHGAHAILVRQQGIPSSSTGFLFDAHQQSSSNSSDTPSISLVTMTP